MKTTPLHRALTAALLTTLASAAAQAATFTWDGGALQDGWSLGTNWVGDVAPSSAQTNDVIIPAGSLGAPIIYFSNYQIHSVSSYASLRIWKDSSLDVSSNSSSSNFGQSYNSILSGTGDFTLTGDSSPLWGRLPLIPNELRFFEEVVSARAEDIIAKWIDYFVMHRSIKPERITRRLK